MKINKILLSVLILILGTAPLLAENPPSDKARGMFVAIGVGPRLPFSSFAKTNTIGYGVTFELDYTDNEYLPLFLYGKLGIEHYPGSQDYYSTTDYSNYNVTLVPFSFGGRYYLPPLVQGYLLVLPHIEASVQIAYFRNLNQFKVDTGLPTFAEDGSRFGFSVGGGFSMFFMEITGAMNIYQSSQNLSLDLKVRLPLFASI